MLPLGILLAVIIFAWGVWAFAEKKALGYGTPWETLFASAVTKAVIALPVVFGMFYFFGKDASVLGIKKAVWAWTLVAMITNGAAIVLLRFVLQKSGVGKTIALTETYAIVTTLLAFIFLGEMPSFTQMSGTIVALTGVYLISRG